MSTTKKTKIKWRLGRLPEPQEIALLIEKGVLSKDEAREILFSLETEEERTRKSLQDEIKFLRELVAKLSTNRSVIIETIREVEKPWKKYDWYQPYYYYSTSAGGSTTGLNYSVANGIATGNNQALLSASSSGLNSQLLQATQNGASVASNSAMDFQDIKTF